MSAAVITVVIVGARGRMGRALIRAVMESDNLTLVGAVDRSGSPGLGEDVGPPAGMPETGVLLSDELRPPRGSVVIDFSLPQATDHNLARCISAGTSLVLGTTGITQDTEQRLAAAAGQIPIVRAANFSVGITVLTRFAELATKALGPLWETEIVELHHRHKRDAPSGTAWRIGQAVAEAAGRDLQEVATTHHQSADTARKPDEIGIVALRGGDSTGEHTLMFLGAGERLELTHRSYDRAIFARGAVRAARWLSGRAPGLYDMADVLGI